MLFVKVFINIFVFAGERVVPLIHFKRMWEYFLPQIIIEEPLSVDLCEQCHSSKELFRANLPNALKFCQLIGEQQRHLDLVKKESLLYQEMNAECGRVCEDLSLSLGPSRAASRKITMSYSFDYTQQVKCYLIY